MNKKNFLIGMSLGAAAIGTAAMAMKPRKKRKMKTAMGKALKTMGEMADSISDSMGW